MPTHLIPVKGNRCYGNCRDENAHRLQHGYQFAHNLKHAERPVFREDLQQRYWHGDYT